MNFNMWFPVRIVSGEGCLKANAKMLDVGKHAFIVCGKHGAAVSGALEDVYNVLDSLGIKYTVFDRSKENPPLMLCYEGGMLCREAGADFVIGIGGGSALDAAKAVALFATNTELEPMDVYSTDKKKNAPLPLLAIPTTSGTGSEANGTSVMSLPGGMRKKSFGTEWPRVAFLDPKYTYSLPADTTMSCALDAFSHAAESYLSPKSTPISRLLAVYAAKNIWSVIKNYPSEYSESDRQTLQNAATAAGLAISVTGTGFPHPLGYSLTMMNGTPHGAACAVFYRHYLEYNTRTEEGKRLVSDFCREINAELSELTEMLPKLSGVNLALTETEIQKYVDLVSSAKNFTNSPYVLSDEEKISIYRELFVKKSP